MIEKKIDTAKFLEATKEDWQLLYDILYPTDRFMDTEFHAYGEANFFWKGLPVLISEKTSDLIKDHLKLLINSANAEPDSNGRYIPLDLSNYIARYLQNVTKIVDKNVKKLHQEWKDKLIKRGIIKNDFNRKS